VALAASLAFAALPAVRRATTTEAVHTAAA
jgi:hypothetical protein